MKFFVIILSILILSILSTLPTEGFAYHTSLYKNAKVFDTFTADKSNYEISKDDKISVKISGKLNDKTFHKGQFVSIIVTYPDETNKRLLGILDSSGEFKTAFQINEKSQIGKYKIVAIHFNLNSTELFFMVSSSDELTKPGLPTSSSTEDPKPKEKPAEPNKDKFQVQPNPRIVIPLWVQDTANMLYNKHISETDFTQSLKYLITNDIIQLFEDQTQKKINNDEIHEWIKKIYILLLNNVDLDDKVKTTQQSQIDDKILYIPTQFLLTEINGRGVEVLAISDVNYLRSLEKKDFTIFPEGGTWYKYDGSSLKPIPLIRTTVPIFHENESGNIMPYKIIVSMIGG